MQAQPAYTYHIGYSYFRLVALVSHASHMLRYAHTTHLKYLT